MSFKIDSTNYLSTTRYYINIFCWRDIWPIWVHLIHYILYMVTHYPKKGCSLVTSTKFRVCTWPTYLVRFVWVYHHFRHSKHYTNHWTMYLSIGPCVFVFSISFNSLKLLYSVASKQVLLDIISSQTQPLNRPFFIDKCF